MLLSKWNFASEQVYAEQDWWLSREQTDLEKKNSGFDSLEFPSLLLDFPRSVTVGKLFSLSVIFIMSSVCYKDYNAPYTNVISLLKGSN